MVIINYFIFIFIKYNHKKNQIYRNSYNLEIYSLLLLILGYSLSLSRSFFRTVFKMVLSESKRVLPPHASKLCSL